MLTAPSAALALAGLTAGVLAADGADSGPEGVPWWVSLFLLPLVPVGIAVIRKVLRVPEQAAKPAPELPRDTDGQLAWAQRMTGLLETELRDEKARVAQVAAERDDEKARVREQAYALAERDGQLVAFRNRVTQLEDEVARLMQLIDTLSGRER